jgi:hypothetical protein
VIFAHRAAKIMLDTSPVRRFAEADALDKLAAFLGNNAYAPAPVLAELRDIEGSFPQIATQLGRNWPRPAPEAPARVTDDILRLQKRFRPPDRQNDPKVNLGEIAAVQLAIHFRFPLLVAEDDLAKQLAWKKIDRISTAMVVAEMVVVDDLDQELGWGIWDASTPDEATRRDYDDGVGRARRDYLLEIYT